MAKKKVRSRPYDKEYYQRNKKRIIAQQIKWQKENKEKLAKYQSTYKKKIYSENPEKFLAKDRERYQKLTTEQRTAYYRKNKANVRKYYKKNRAKIVAYSKAYYQKNRERLLAYQNERNKAKKNK